MTAPIRVGSHPLHAAPPTLTALVRLAAASLLPVLLLLTRLEMTGRLTYIFLLWNLWLAWLPVLLAWAARRLMSRSHLAAPLSLLWLLFLPNAPYLLTDLMHLRFDDGVPVLFDVILLVAFAACGLALGFVSLAWMQAGVHARWGAWPARVFALSTLTLTGFGIYLGRYLRWNSWDALLQPGAILADLRPLLAHPLYNWQPWGFAALFALLLIFLYGLPALCTPSVLRDSQSV